jgi:hypothetical protein
MKNQLLTNEQENSVKKMGRKYYTDFIEKNSFNNEKRNFGIEIEFSIVNENNNLIPKSAPAICNKIKEYPLSTEYGSFQIEINPPPMNLTKHSYKKLYDLIQETRRKIEEKDTEKNIQLIPIGIPFYVNSIDFNSKNIITPSPRYLISTNYFHKVNKTGSYLYFSDSENINLPGNSGLSIINELHVHLQALNKRDLISLFNYSQMITSPFVSLGANSGIVNNKELIYKDFQISIFEQAEGLYDGPPNIPRTGLYPGYINTIDDFFNAILDFKPLYYPKDGLDSTAFELIIGKYFGWTRIRVGYDPSPHLRIEFRPMSSQPTIIENIALSEFFINTILGLIDDNHILLPEKYLKNNLYSAMKFGMNAKLFWDMGKGVKQYPVDSILNYLLNLSVDGIYSDTILKRINQKMSPAEKLIEDTKKFGFAKSIINYKNCFENEIPFIN